MMSKVAKARCLSLVYSARSYYLLIPLCASFVSQWRWDWLLLAKKLIQWQVTLERVVAHIFPSFRCILTRRATSKIVTWLEFLWLESKLHFVGKSIHFTFYLILQILILQWVFHFCFYISLMLFCLIEAKLSPTFVCFHRMYQPFVRLVEELVTYLRAGLPQLLWSMGKLRIRCCKFI